MTPRATPLSPDERRSSIVEAVLPLVIERGELPSSREVAAAAGIAEGTIYRAFDDKAALLHAVAERALTMPPTPSGPLALEELPDLHARVAELARRMQQRMQIVHTVFMAVRRQLLSEGRHGPGEDGPPAYVAEANEQLHRRLVAVLEIDRDRLRVEPETAATVLRSLVFGCAHPAMGGEPLTPEQIADLVIHGVAHPATGEDR